jgi:hypothetical protein
MGQKLVPRATRAIKQKGRKPRSSMQHILLVSALSMIQQYLLFFRKIVAHVYKDFSLKTHKIAADQKHIFCCLRGIIDFHAIDMS